MYDRKSFWSGARFGAHATGFFAVAALLGLAVLCGCCPPCGDRPPWWPGPPTATPAPTAIPATPTPAPGKPYQIQVGHISLAFTGIRELPLSPVADTRTIATLTWEREASDRGAPVMELQIRGATSEPCLARPCRDKAGLVVRYSASINHDAGLPEGRHCGEGTNYHRRIALGPLEGGRLVVNIELAEESIRVSTPVDSWFSTLPGARGFSFGLGRFIVGSPFARADIRGWSWKPLLDGSPWIRGSVESWAGTLGKWRECGL